MPLRHNLLAAFVALLWGINFVAIDVGLETFPPLLFVALRFALTAFPAVLFVRRPAVAARWIVAVGFFLSVGQFGLLFVAIHVGMPAGLSSLVLQLQVVFTIALAVAFLGERPSRFQLCGAGVAFAGLAVVAGGRAQSVPLGAVLLVVAAGASWGVSNICTRMAKPSDGFAFLIWASLVGPIPLTGLSFAFEGSGAMARAFGSLNGPAVVSLLYVVLISTLFGFGAWTFLLARHSASDVAPFSLLAPVAALVATWLARGERPGPAELAGGIIILIGLALTVVPPPGARWRRARPIELGGST
ncbi:MAG TPA: EamA family transporter [Gaiellaceae bacterium]|jgi:O-acetylserine/cysteine efflux transporter|nr:EamA family transporter [Gaiellaceae bacterium]